MSKGVGHVYWTGKKRFNEGGVYPKRKACSWSPVLLGDVSALMGCNELSTSDKSNSVRIVSVRPARIVAAGGVVDPKIGLEGRNELTRRRRGARRFRSDKGTSARDYWSVGPVDGDRPGLAAGRTIVKVLVLVFKPRTGRHSFVRGLQIKA